MNRPDQKSKQKMGRNAPCPCGSGKKYKLCHGAQKITFEGENLSIDQGIKQKISEHEAIQKQRERQQGLGRPIISTRFNGKRVVAVGSRVFSSDNWKTFHDFLSDYLKIVLSGSWGNAELKKPLNERHPVMQWYDSFCRYQRETIKNKGQIYSAPMTGAAKAYLRLSYNLYLLAHNAKIQSKLIDDLKNINGFWGAHYETYVAAAFINAGFKLDLEDEGDSTRTHCEFVATSSTTGKRYSVEAKARQPGKQHTHVKNQLYKALRKDTEHVRVIFIDVNVPDGVEDLEWLQKAAQGVRDKEESMTIDGSPAPAAFVFLTNHPYHYGLDKTNIRSIFWAEGFKIPEFKLESPSMSLREALQIRVKYADICQLASSLRTHYEIPATFDGEIPEFAFFVTEPRLKVGEKYVVPTADDTEKVGELKCATVIESEKKAWGVYTLEDGASLIATTPLSDNELAAYRRHPDTFFGVCQPVNKKVESQLDLFDFFYDSYRHMSKDALLKFFENDTEYEHFKNESQENLLVRYCERLVTSLPTQP